MECGSDLYERRWRRLCRGNRERDWLANFLVSLIQFGDGAIGTGPLTGANEMALKLVSGTSVFWDAQILTAATPISGQTFTLTAEVLN